MKKVDISAVLPANKTTPKLPNIIKYQAQKILSSGELGRSKNYALLLNFLVQCSIDGRIPKEFEIATEVLHRSKDFDVSSDSTVRVYIHQLRKKIDSYYQKYDADPSHRLVIPKGQYTVIVSERPVESSELTPKFSFLKINNKTLLLTAVVLLLSNILYMYGRDLLGASRDSDLVGDKLVWTSLFDDDQPIMLVMGDYYIFGELNANGNIARMVREFNVNSKSDLEDLQFSDIENAQNYLDLNLSYMPEGSAFALAKLAPILQQSGKTVNITMISDLTAADIRSNHIVYIGYISALEKLTNMVFAASGLAIGRSYDELENRNTGEYYTSDAGLPEEGDLFKDFGLFSTFPASSETQLIVVAGMRDAGLMHTAQVLANAQTLEHLLEVASKDSAQPLNNFEALYEVYGIDRLNFDANLVYTNRLDPNLIWRNARPLLN